MEHSQNHNMSSSIALVRMMRQRNVLGLMLILSLLTLILLSYKLVMKTEKVIIVPSKISHTYELDHTINKEYLEDMSQDIIWGFLNLSEDSTGYQLEQILKETAVSSKSAVKQSYLRTLKILAKRHATTNYIITKLYGDVKHKTSYVSGTLYTYMGNQLISKNEESYRLKFSYTANKFLLTSFQQIEKMPN